jgi:hypothetical protein
MTNNVAEGSFHFFARKTHFSIFWWKKNEIFYEATTKVYHDN